MLRLRITLLTTSVLLMLGLGELVARWLVPVREVGASFSLHDPVLGKRHKPNLSATRWTPEFTMRLTTNSLGQRGPEPLNGADPSAARLLFTGDSFTEGYGVDDGEEFPRVVERELRALGLAVEAVNEGVGDTGTGRALRLVRGYDAGAGRTTLLVHQLSMNDFDDDVRDGFFALDPAGRLVENPNPVPKGLLRRIQPLLDEIPGLSHSHLFAAVVQIARMRRNAPPAPAGAAVPASPAAERAGGLTLRLLAELGTCARERHWPLLLISADADDEVARMLEAVARETGAEYVPMATKQARPDLYYRVDGHWNRAGHAEAAARLRPALHRLLAGHHG